MQTLNIHPDNPQPRLLQQAVQCIQRGGVVIYPTDSCYALGCDPTHKKALERIRQLRQLDVQHPLALICRTIAEMARYGQLEQKGFRIVKALVPGPCTFLLRATAEVPRRLQHTQHKSIGLRIPDNTLAMALLAALEAPLMTTSLILPNEAWPLDDREAIEKQCQSVDILLWSGPCGVETTTVLDLQRDDPVLVRAGKQDVSDWC